MRKRKIPWTLLIINILVLLSSVIAKKSQFSSKSKSRSTQVQPQPQSKTFISEIIGFSAFKFLLILGIPLVFSIFLGAMLVLLFPFPLLTSTTGLAGAAAIGRRQGREHDSNSLTGLGSGDDLTDLLTYLGVIDPIVPSVKKVKQRYPVYHRKEKCAERVACEIGRSASNELKVIINQVINELDPKSQQRWKPVIQAYYDGSQVFASLMPTPPPTAPVYHHEDAQNFYCFRYKCHL